ncbi:Non-functional NADPH-dependent codeinone reductase 2 [Ancistrocladus abbreviatus]
MLHIMENNSEATSSRVPKAQLSHGCGSMPLLGLGMAVNPSVEPEVTKAAVLNALELGYRHFDTACLYGTEQPLGEAIEDAIGSGLIQSRDELFITSKLWCSDGHQELVVPALHKTLQNLKMEYLDLYLIHWPVSSKPGVYEYPIKEEDFLPMDYKSVWAAMEECQRLGLTKAIGVSNFSCKKLMDVLANATIPPAVNQVEVNPSWQQKKHIEFCKANGILVTAYSPLGAVGTSYGSNKVLQFDVLKEIAKARGKTVPQICLRWAYEQGISVVVKSFHRERMKENLQIFDWQLSLADHKKISTISQSRVITGSDYISSFRPFKTLDELWDGEV